MTELDLQKLVESFTDLEPKYEKLKNTIEQILTVAGQQLAPRGKVDARVKTRASFAEKCLRKTYTDPFVQMTDLVGGRVVAYTRAETDAVCHWLENEEGFEIDWANSPNTLNRLKPGEFGYRARHYVVRLKEPKIKGVDVIPAIRSLKCEIQVCTYLEHIWAAIEHDRMYKTSITPPKALERKAAEVAAMLEASDEAFAATVTALDHYIESFEAHLSLQQVEEQLARQRSVLSVDPDGPEAAALKHSIGRLLLAADRPQQAREALKSLAKSDRPDVLRTLARTEMMLGNAPAARGFLQRAIEINPGDFMSHVLLGDTYVVDEPGIAVKHYADAHEVAPEEPLVLVPYIDADLRQNKDARVLRMIRGSFLAGIKECQRRIELKVHLPESYFEEGRLGLYLQPDKPWDSLAAYCRAIAACDHCKPIFSELVAMERIINSLASQPDTLLQNPQLRGFVWVWRLLQLGLSGKVKQLERQRQDLLNSMSEAAGDDKHASLKRAADELMQEVDQYRTRADLTALATQDAPPGFKTLPKPILIVAGGCHREHEKVIFACEELMRKALDGFTGTIVGGGTDVGIGKLVADAVAHSSTGNPLLMAYLPKPLPDGDALDTRYQLVVNTPDHKQYTPLGPMQTWADLIRCGISPADVRLLGINGGQLSAFEFRLALALGAKAGVVQQSGREAERLLPDPFWRDFVGLAPLPKDWATIAAFINSAHPEVLTVRPAAEQMARILHNNYRDSTLTKPGRVADNLLPWEKLPVALKSSNFHQAAYCVMILRRAGFDVLPLDPAQSAVPPASFEERITRMAELEHGRYCAERLSNGWRLGAKNDAALKTNPTLVPWELVTANDRKYDEISVARFPEILKMAGLRIVEAKR